MPKRRTRPAPLPSTASAASPSAPSQANPPALEPTVTMDDLFRMLGEREVKLKWAAQRIADLERALHEVALSRAVPLSAP